MAYPKELHENELPFLTERMKIGRVEKVVPSLKDRKGYVVHIKTLDQALKHGLNLKSYTGLLSFNKVNV